MPLVDRETRTPVLKHDPGAGNDHARPEVTVDAVDERDHVAFGIGDRQIDGLAVGQEAPGLHPLGWPLEIDQCTASRKVLFREQILRRNAHMIRIRDVLGEVGVGQLLHLRLEVDVLGRVVLHGVEVEAVQHPEHLERCDPLVGRRKLVHPVPAERHGNGVHPLDSVTCQILDRQESAQLLQPLGDRRAERSPIEDADAVAGDRPQGSREIGIPVPLTGSGRSLTVDQVHGPRSVIPPELLDLIRPVLRNDRRHREPFLGKADGGCQRLGQGERPMPLEKRGPSGE